MELEKKKETQWVIKKHNDPNKVIYLKSIEESGIIVKITIGIRESEKELIFETNPEEFKNLYAIFKSFRDLLYSEGLDILHEAIKQEEDSDKNLNENKRLNSEEYVNSITEKELANLKKIERGQQEDFKDNEIRYDEKSIEEYEKADEILEDLKEIPNDEKTQEILKTIDEIQLDQRTNTKETSDFKREDPTSNSKKEKNSNEKLDPTEWDPW